MSFNIVGTGRAHPDFVLNNAMLSEMVDTDNEWIVSRTGINTRYVCTTEDITELSVKAGQRALEKAGLDPSELDLILVSTMKGDYACPSLSCLVQRGVGSNCPAVDLNAACSGFVYGLDMAAAYFEAGKAEKILLIGAETMTRHLDWTDRATCVLFGDGAGAVILQKGDGLKAIRITAKGDDQLLVIGSTFCKSPFGIQEEKDPRFRMKGKEVFRFAVSSVLRDVREVMKTAGITAEDVALVVPHQANLRVFQAAKEKLGFREEQIAIGIDHYGNTSSASIPLMLDELVETGRLKKGDIIVLTAFGGGLTTGACVIEF